MKKLLVLSLVLGMATLASAGFSIAGYDGSDLAPGDSITLQVVSADVAPSGYAYVYLVALNDGIISGGVKGVGSLTMDNAGTTTSFFGVDGIGIDWYIGDSTGATLNGVAIDGITFACNGTVPSVVQLWATPDFANFELADSITISQVPEPMTMALLGLGGLFLRRRK